MGNTFDDWKGESLQHYGVLGMKWGVRKDPQRAFDKAYEKKRKLESRYADSDLNRAKAHRNMLKVYDKQAKVENKRVGPSDEGYEAYKQKSAKAYSNSVKATNKYQKANVKALHDKYKVEKWTSNVLGAFGSLSLSELEEKYGKKAG